MKKSFYIVGIKHCGKSTVGKILAKDLNIPYYDLDELIEQSVGTSVRSFYIKEGKEAFQQQETLALKKLNTIQSSDFVCGTGGGISDNKQALEILEKTSGKIFINTSFTTVYSRIVKNGIPPFLKTNNPEKEFQNMYNRRTNIYKNICNFEINGDNKTPDQIKIEILNKIKEPQIARK